MNDHISRREFIKSALGTAAALSAPTIINYLGNSSPSSDKELLEIRDDKFYMGGDEYIIKGANYLTRDHPWQMFEEYDPEQIDKELGIAEELGVNTVRIAIMHPYAWGEAEPKEIPNDGTKIDEEYFENFNNFLALSDRHNMKVMPIATSFMPWSHFKPQNFDLTEEYLETWLPQFREDERIIAWDVKNEPDLHKNFFEDKSGNYDIPGYTKEAAKFIKEIDPNHPVTIGLSDTHAPPGEVEENLISDLPKYIQYEDFYSFHFYVPIKFFDPAVEKIRNQTDKPIVLQEFGLPTTGADKNHTEKQQEWYINELLKRVDQKGLNGAMVWELNDHLKEAKVDNKLMPEAERERHNGILRVDHSKKPAAHVVEQYYKWIL